MGVESVDRHGRCSLPNLQQPGLSAAGLHEVIEPTGFGPIAPRWAVRRDKLGERAPDVGERRWDGETLGPDFDADYFQTAPLDQVIDELHADEAIVLENLHPDHPDLVTRLPGVRPVVRVEAPDLPAWELALVADTLWIDTDRSICTLTWRGQIPLQERDPALVVRIGLEAPGQPVQWPSGFEPAIAADEASPELSHTAVDDHLLGAMETGRMAARSAPSAMPTWLRSSPPAPRAPIVMPPAPVSSLLGRRDLIESEAESPSAPRAAMRTPAAPAYVGVLEASNAAAGAPREALSSTIPARREIPAAAPSTASLPARALQELVWFDPDCVPRLRQRADWAAWMGPAPAPAPPDDLAAVRAQAQAERASVAAVLARGAGIHDIEAAVADAVTEEGAFEPPLCLASGELELAFDEVATLKLLVAAAGPLAPGDKRLKEVIDQAGEVMKTPLGESPDVAAGFIARLRDAWSKASRILPADYLDHHTRRLLLDQRLYQRRSLGNAAWIRALFTPTGASVPVPIYLPEAIGPWLPLFTRFTARVIADALPQQDQHETSPVALRACALARVLPPRPRARNGAA
jgi:hypothetical protein